MPKPRISLILLLCHMFILQLAFTISGIRKDVGLKDKRICKTTVQGRYLLSDDWGHVCDALSVDPVSRCCSGKGAQFDCHGCNLDSQCCNSYEFCVSCCQDPAHTHKELALSVKIAKPSTAGTYSSVFDFCAGRCRHNSESVVHENAYLSDFHHCFSIPSNSSGTTGDHVEARLAGINVIVGRQGESCDSVCKLNGQSCVPNKLLALNQCEIVVCSVIIFLLLLSIYNILVTYSIQKYMRCKGACLASIGADQPAEVVDDAPRHLVAHRSCGIEKGGDFLHSIGLLLV
ncbi:hypothetical protein RHGRI_025705 [Rhododendron griersonianum]|uniref:SREBP regulating gene protein n=1 Tax=Rhododendron griersonianum TaxID=479676 RepID=A0AAV6IUM1_9ERIC|nr:hypothetical protein RHGRI_025705 [Rhododendron griersonianum]